VTKHHQYVGKIKAMDKYFRFSLFICVRSFLKTQLCKSTRTSREVVVHILFVPIGFLIVPSLL